MKKKFTSCDFFCIIALLCFLNGSLYAGGSALAQGFQLILIAMSMFYWYVANTQYKLPIFFKGLNVLLLLFTIYGVAVIIENPTWARHGTQTFLKQVYKSLLPIYSFYVFAKRDQFTIKKLKFWYMVFFILVVRSYYLEDARLSSVIEESGTAYTSLTNNAAYRFVGVLPGLVLFRKKPVIQYSLMAVCAYFLISGMKRGAMLCGAVCLLWFIFSNYKVANNKQRRIILIVTIAIILLGVFYVNYMMETSNFFQHRVQQTKEGDSSNRDYIYGTLWQHFLNEENILRILFGNGVYSTVRFIGTPAHNDWLEIVTGQGVLGVFIYVIYWVCFFITWRRSRKCPETFMIIGMTLICYFLSSCFSMSYDSVSRSAGMTLGFALASMSGKNLFIEETGKSSAGFIECSAKQDVV